MKVVLLCGGKGRRMFPITEDKFLLDFLGKTLLEHQIDMAVNAGLSDFVIVGNRGNIERIRKIIAGLSGVKIELVIQEKHDGIAGALLSAAQNLNSEVIIVNPNDVIESSAYNILLHSYRSTKADSYLLGYHVSNYFPGGYLEVDKAGNLVNIVEKPGKGNEPSDMVNVLVHLHTDPAELLRNVANISTENDDVYERAIYSMAKDNKTIRVVPYRAAWTPIKYPWHILGAVRHFLDRTGSYIAPSAQISERAVVEGTAFISNNVRVMENAVIRGPVYIGPGTVIGNGSLVREYSHIGAECVVGFSTEVKGSYIGDKCWFHMCYVGDTIIGHGCSFGAGTVFANWRFDEKNISVMVGNELIDTGLDKFGAIVGDNCRTGVHASLMPGVKVGPNSIVGAATSLTRDLAPDSMAISSPDTRILQNIYRPANGST
jgi:bifunctional UDP-N-acetylglucosamine pyrophosphorylase/glucosamine-1-phosphate N-acetyltransferase